jgi:ribosome modulation factor
MKLQHILEMSAIKPPKWLEGYNAFWDGTPLAACPYEDEDSKNQWTNGWQYGSIEE